jgi:DNA polymerase-3 subunit epsilon
MIALFFDTETTGVKSWKDPDFVPKLVQIGAILQDTDTKRVLAEINLIIDQNGVHIPEGASNVHGISDELADRFGVSIESVDLIFAQLIRRSQTIIAHNIQYDLEVVKDNLPASWHGLDGIPTFCTMLENLMIVKAPLTDKQRAYFGMKGVPPDSPYKVPSLTQTYKHFFGTEFEGAHDAMADIRACRDIFFAMDIV